MALGKNHRLGILLAIGFVSYGVGGCDPTNETGPGTAQTPGSGGASSNSDTSKSTVSTGGKTTSKATSATGGNSGRGGAKNSSKAPETGGAKGDPEQDSGGSTATDTSATGGATQKSSSKSSSGGASQDSSTTNAAEKGGSGNSSAKGGAAAGGKSSSPGSSATGGKSASSTATGGVGIGGKSASGGSSASTGSGDCKKGQVAAKEVAIMGESFYAMAPQYIQKRIEENAKKAGAIGSGDSYRNVAISGQPMSVVVGEFDTALKGGPVKVVIMDGGGIDCMSSSCPNCPNLFKTVLEKMATNGVQSVIYTRYPEPGAPPGSNATLKKNLDALMPEMEKVCKASTNPPCYWVDLRPVWQTGDTTDGLHPTQSGGNHCGDAIWAEMVKQCIAQ